MKGPRSIKQRPFLWMLVVALMVLAAISVSRILALRVELQQEMRNQLRVQVQDLVATWESTLIDQLGQWVEDAAADPSSTAAAQRSMRKRKPWFDTLYLWVPPPDLPINAQPKQVRGTLLYPRYPSYEDTRRLLLHPCLGRARALSVLQDANPVEMAGLYVEGCRREPLPVRLAATTEAANLLKGEGRYQAALGALDAAHLPDDLPITKAITQGVPPFRVVGHRTLRAEILMSLGQMDLGLDLLYDTGVQIAALDATVSAGVLSYVNWPILAELQAHGRREQAQGLQAQLLAAETRARAWREVEDRLLPRPASQVGEARFVYDQYSENPFLIYYGLSGDGEFGVALALDQPLLLEEFLSELPRRREYLVITDASGERVAGTEQLGTIGIQVPFTRALTHLRVGVHEDAIKAEVGRYGNQWITPLLVTVVFVLVGIGGLWAQIRATDRQYELMMRQREFTTRVTHELKTPLAGIRVMAENLESGAFKDERHRQTMAQRIMDEADRLTERVDQILAAGRRRTLPDAKVYDPEEAVLEAVDQWGPRMHASGVTLTADLHPTDEIKGDKDALRDAVGCLLDNALKYRRESVEAQAWLTLEQDGKHVLIDVADNGIGIPADMRDAIFERFVRVEGPHRGRAGGHGLGLSQVAEIVEMHRGTVHCTEGVDGGTRFTLRIPAVG